MRPVLALPQIGRALQSARKARLLTQSQVAARLNLSQSRISFLEQHPGSLSLAQLLVWCSILGLELGIGMKGRAPQTPTHTPEW